MTQPKTAGSMRLLTFVVGMALVGVVGTAIGVDWRQFLDAGAKLFSDNARGKQVCLSVTNLPPQDVTVSWHAGVEEDTFTDLEVQTWEHCEPAVSGETWHLLVEKTRAGYTTCEATLVPPGTTLAVRTRGGTTDCSIGGVIP